MCICACLCVCVCVCVYVCVCSSVSPHAFSTHSLSLDGRPSPGLDAVTRGWQLGQIALFQCFLEKVCKTDGIAHRSESRGVCFQTGTPHSAPHSAPQRTQGVAHDDRRQINTAHVSNQVRQANLHPAKKSSWCACACACVCMCACVRFRKWLKETNAWRGRI